MHNDSAEEKLLKLIKGASARPGQKRIDDSDALRLNAPKKTQHNITAAVKSRSMLEIATDKIRHLSLGSVNKILRLIIVAICVVFISSFIFNAKNVKNILNEKIGAGEGGDINVLPKPLSADFKDYSVPAGRDIFGASGSQSTGAQSLGSGQNFPGAVSNLKVLGIISGAKPQAVIEDDSEQKTYTVGVGDYFRQFLVEDIGSGKVSFSYKGERFELFL